MATEHWEGEAPAEPDFGTYARLGRSLALPNTVDFSVSI